MSQIHPRALADSRHQPLVGTHADHVCKPPRQYPAGRRCSVCLCILSIYNPDSVCALHSDTATPLCAVPSCGLWVQVAGMCRSHYKAMSRLKLKESA